MEQWGKDILIIDEDKESVIISGRKLPLSSRSIPLSTYCTHDQGVDFLRDGQYEKVLISGDEGKALDAINLAFIAANFSASRVGVLSSHGLLPVEIAERYFIVNATLVFFSNGEGEFRRVCESDVKAKNWYRFLQLCVENTPSFFVMPNT